MADIPNFQPRTQPIDPTALISATQNKAVLEHNADEQRKQRRMEMVQGIVKAVEQGQTIAMNQLKLSSERSRLGAQKELAELMTRPSADKQVAAPIEQTRPAVGPPTASGASPVIKSMVTPTYGSTQTGAKELEERPAKIQSALFRANPEDYVKNATKAQFPKTSSTGGKEQVYFLTLDDGSNITTRFDQTGRKGFMDMEGNPLDSALMKRVVNRTYAGDFGTDPATGGKTFGNKSTGQVTPVSSTAPKASDSAQDAIYKLRTDAPKVAEQFIKDREQALPQNNQFLKEQVTRASAASQVRTLLSDPDPSSVGLKSLGFQFAVLSGSNSQLSDAEREQFEKPLAFLRQLENTGYKFVMGDLSPTMRKDLIRLSTTLEKKAKVQGNKIIQSTKNNAKLQVGPFWSSGLEKSFPSIDDLVASQSEIGLTPQESAPTEGSNGFDLGDGFSFKVNP